MPRDGDSRPTELDDAPKIFVGGVPFNMEADDLKRLFSKFGAITDVTVSLELNSRYFTAEMHA